MINFLIIAIGIRSKSQANRLKQLDLIFDSSKLQRPAQNGIFFWYAWRILFTGIVIMGKYQKFSCLGKIFLIILLPWDSKFWNTHWKFCTWNDADQTSDYYAFHPTWKHQMKEIIIPLSYPTRLEWNCLVNGPWFRWFHLMCIISSAKFSSKILTSESEADVLYSFNANSDWNNDFVCNSDLRRVRNFSEKSIRKRSILWIFKKLIFFGPFCTKI